MREFFIGALRGFVFGLVLLVVATLLLGCAVNMTHPTKAANHQDFYECQQVGERRAAAWSGHDAPNPFLFRDFTIECLERRGWHKSN